MDFIKLNVSGSKLNIPKLIRACERHYHWQEAVFLYIHYDEYAGREIRIQYIGY